MVAREIHAKGCVRTCLTASRRKQWGEASPQLFIDLFWCVNDSYLPKVLELLPDPHGFTRHQEYSCSSQTSSLHFIPNFQIYISLLSYSSNQKESAYIEDISLSPSSHNKQSQSSSGLAVNLLVFKANGNVPECSWVHKDICLLFKLYFT